MKAPAFQFYVKDWLSDPQLKMAPFPSKGIWIDLLCFMWASPEQGKLTGTQAEFSKMVGATPEEIKSFLLDASRLKFADVTERNENVTIINRRMYNEWKDKEATRLRVQRFRNKGDGNAPCNDDVTSHTASASASTTTKPIEEPKGSLSESGKINSDGNDKIPPCPQKEIVDLYHKKLPSLPRVKTWAEHLQAILRTRWKEDPQRQDLKWWGLFFEYIHKSDFLMGRTDTPFTADLEWLIRPKNFAKIANGRYHKGQGTQHRAQPGIEAWLKRKGEENAAQGPD